MSREEASPSLREIKRSQSHTKLKAPQRTERARESQSSWASADDDDVAVSCSAKGARPALVCAESASCGFAGPGASAKHRWRGVGAYYTDPSVRIMSAERSAVLLPT